MTPPTPDELLRLAREAVSAPSWSMDPRCKAMLLDLLAMVDALRAELAGAEERGRQRERADAVHHLRTRRQTTAICTEGSARSQAADEIARGDHVRTGTTPPDAGESGP